MQRFLIRLISRVFRSLNKFNTIPYIFIAFMLRCTFTGASIGDAIAVLGVSALVGWKLHLDSKRKPDFSKDLVRELVTMREEVAMMKLSAPKKTGTFNPRPDQRLF